MSQDNNSNRQNADRGGSPGSSLLLWAGLIVATGLLVAVWVTPYFYEDLSATDLTRLIEASPHESVGGPLASGATGYVDVRDEKKTRRFSNLRDVQLKDRSVVGTVDIVTLKPVPNSTSKELTPDSATTRLKVPFRTNLGTESEHRKSIEGLLRTNKFDVRFDAGPSPWDQHAPWILIFVLGLF